MVWAPAGQTETDVRRIVSARHRRSDDALVVHVLPVTPDLQRVTSVIVRSEAKRRDWLVSEDAKPILYARLHSERGDIYLSILQFLLSVQCMSKNVGNYTDFGTRYADAAITCILSFVLALFLFVTISWWKTIIIKPFFYASSVATSVPLPVGLSQLLGDGLELF